MIHQRIDTQCQRLLPVPPVVWTRAEDRARLAAIGSRLREFYGIAPNFDAGFAALIAREGGHA